MDLLRTLRILARLRTLTSELSRYEETDVSDTSTFRELGFDASLLTELLAELTDELPTLSAVASYFDGELLRERLVPSENVAAATSEGGSALPVPVAASELPGSHAAGIDSAPEPFPAVGVDGRAARIRDIMRKQLLVMAEQIQLMRSLNRASPSAFTSTTSLIAETGTEESAAADVAKAMEAVVEASDALHPIHGEPPESAFVQTAHPGPRVVPLTEGQREIWIASQMSDEASCAFNVSASLAISGPLDIDRFVQAVITVLAEQEAFRYRFDSEGESQWVDELATFELPLIDFSELDEVSRTARLDAWIDQEALKPFDLERGPLVRPQLFKLEARLHLFAIYCHHIIFDGFSSDIVMRKIADAYPLVKDPASGYPSTVPYSVYVERAALVDRDESAASLAYWCSEFEESVPPPA